MHAQDFAQSFNILLKVKLSSYIASYLTVTSHTLYISTTYALYMSWTALATLIIS